MTVRCIDISHHQDFPDFDEVRDSGVIAMIHKATEGSSYIDPNRAINIAGAMKAGISCCTYHWLSPTSSPTEQMEFYLETVNPVHGERMVIDYEENGCVLEDLREAVSVLKADPRNLKVTVYSGHLLKEQLGDVCDEYLAESTDLWLAHYTGGEPTWSSATYPAWKLWQYTDQGSIPGIYTNVDLDEFNGSDDELLDWITPSIEKILPRVEVNVEINIPDGIEVSISINGVELACLR
jgi:lysozyme